MSSSPWNSTSTSSDQAECSSNGVPVVDEKQLMADKEAQKSDIITEKSPTKLDNEKQQNEQKPEELPRTQSEQLYRNLSEQSYPSRAYSHTTGSSSYASSQASSELWGLANPLAHLDREELFNRIDAFAHEKGLQDLIPELRKGALVAQNPRSFELLEDLTEEDKEAFRREITNKWDQPPTLYWLVACCSMAAVVQGMDETVINGAQLEFEGQFGIADNRWIVGAVNAAPYIGCAVLGCWLTHPWNKMMGRKGTIAVTAAISAVTCFWQAVTDSWAHLFVARLILGIGGIGPKSTTVPVFSAECTPAPIRGSLVMMWQMWTAFGIMLGYLADVAFINVKDPEYIVGLNWRLMLGSAGIPAVIVFFQVFFLPESPRYLMGRNRYRDAYKSLRRLRKTSVQACKDLYYIHVFLELEKDMKQDRDSLHRLRELLTIPRNLRAVLASSIVMSGQQLCGVNTIVYYSSVVFDRAGGFSRVSSLLASFGFGLINFFFAIPAFYTIDSFGRRNLLLTTFPLMAICLLITGFSFWINPDRSREQLAGIIVGIYLYGIVYSPGEGPVPFTYSAEVFPLYIRDLGMSIGTAQTWGLNAILAVTFPPLLEDAQPQGAFGVYAGFCLIIWVLVLFFVPESKALTLEELDNVFSVQTKTHAAYQLRQVGYFVKRYILRRKIDKELLYEHEYEEYYAANGITPPPTPRRSTQSHITRQMSRNSRASRLARNTSKQEPQNNIA